MKKLFKTTKNSLIQASNNTSSNNLGQVSQPGSNCRSLNPSTCDVILSSMASNYQISHSMGVAAQNAKCNISNTSNLNISSKSTAEAKMGHQIQENQAILKRLENLCQSGVGDQFLVKVIENL